MKQSRQGWRVAYPDGTEHLYRSEENARREAEASSFAIVVPSSRPDVEGWWTRTDHRCERGTKASGNLRDDVLNACRKPGRWRLLIEGQEVRACRQHFEAVTDRDWAHEIKVLGSIL